MSESQVPCGRVWQKFPTAVATRYYCAGRELCPNCTELLTLRRRVAELEAALRPLAALGGPQDLTATPAYHDLEDDVVIYQNSGAVITAGDVRAVRDLLRISP